MSKRIISAQHAHNTAAKGKIVNPLVEGQPAVPGVTDGFANPFVQAVKQVPAGKPHKADPKAHTDADADKAHKDNADDTAYAAAPVESTASGAAHMMMVAADAADDQASGGASDASTPAASDDGDHHDSTPIILGVGALAIGGAVAALAGGSSSTPTPTNHAPTLAAASATVTVPENSPTTTTVFTAVATDTDVGDTITYSLSGTDAALLSISSTGVVTLKASADFETKPTYTFNVVATDKAGLSASEAVTLNVTNVNEVPVITSNGGGDTAAITVNENQTAVTTVTATDVDASATKTFTLSGADAAKFAISSTGVLTFVTAPNFEAPTDVGADNVYNVSVTVTDNGTPGLTDVQAIAVTVANVNETPVITSNGGGDTAAVNVFENSTVVTAVVATDVDANATKTYSITGGADAAKFTINSSGVLSFITAPNFEAPTDVGANNIYDVIVTVTDNGTPGLTDSQAIAVTVVNVNEPPAFTSPASFSVAENGTAVGSVVAVDPEGVASTYSIVGGADQAKFAINAATGALSFVSAPNFEAPTDVGGNNVYDVIVRATDGTNPLDQAIAVTVTDVNEIPVFSSGATGSVAENAATTTIVYDANATDPESTTLTYTLGGTDQAAFNINVTTGEVRLNAPADFEAKPSYSISVTATDNGSPTHLAATQNVTISVTDQVDLANLPTSATFNAGVQAVGQTDTNFRLTDDGDVTSAVTINNFTANDVIVLTHADLSLVGFQRENATDLRINYSDTGDTNAISSIVVTNVLTDAFSNIDSEDSARAAMGPTFTNVDFFQLG